MPFTQPHAMPMVTTALLGSALSASLIFGLSACADKAAPKEPAPASSSSSNAEPVTTAEPSPTESPSEGKPQPMPPKKPEAMKQNNEEGAIAFTNYFLDVYEYTGQTLDTEPLSEASDSSCEFCNEVIENSQELKTLGNSLSGYKFTVQTPFTVTMTSEHAFGLHGVIKKSAYVIEDAQGAEVSVVPEDLMPVGIAVRYADSEWTVFAFGREEFVS